VFIHTQLTTTVTLAFLFGSKVSNTQYNMVNVLSEANVNTS